jgi:hypothetical protein
MFGMKLAADNLNSPDSGSPSQLAPATKHASAMIHVIVQPRTERQECDMLATRNDTMATLSRQLSARDRVGRVRCLQTPCCATPTGGLRGDSFADSLFDNPEAIDGGRRCAFTALRSLLQFLNLWSRAEGIGEPS